jgi:hypothetical protein
VQIPGRLSETTLGDVLGALHRRRVTGLIRLRENAGHGAGRVHGVHLAAGEVVAVETQAQVPALGEILMQRGLLDAIAQRRLRHRMATGTERRVGEILIEEGFVSADVVAAALRKQLRAKLDALFRVEDATLSFHVACPTPLCPTAPLSPREFLRGRPRARDRAARTARPYLRDDPRRAASAPHSSARKRSEALALLGLEDHATLPEVTRAFRLLAARYHPDRHVQAGEGERRAMVERFAALSAAYHTVMG